MGFDSTFYFNMKRFISLAPPPRQPLSSQSFCLLQRCLQSSFFPSNSFFFFLYIYLFSRPRLFFWLGVSGDRRAEVSQHKEESRQQVGEYEDSKDERKTRIALVCSDRV